MKYRFSLAVCTVILLEYGLFELLSPIGFWQMLIWLMAAIIFPVLFFILGLIVCVILLDKEKQNE